MADETDDETDGGTGEPGDEAVEAHVAAAWAACRRGDPEAGIIAAQSALALAPRHGEVWYALAVCHERAGRLGRADRCFHRAAHAHSEPQSMPYRITWIRFCALVERSAAALPEKLAAAFGEVTLVLADYPDPDVLADVDERELLGLFVGAVRAERSPGSEQPGLPPQIHLYRRAHEHACSTREELAAEVRSTLIHELGHYLGYGEEDLEALGW
jgi:predicted Zn-dependent protease with MMP-like domain